MKTRSCRRIFAFVLAGSVLFSGGAPWTDARAESAVPTALNPSVGSGISDMFGTDTTKPIDDTWMFAGGAEAQGRFSEIGFARNYVGQFEEYIRFEKARNSEALRQRHVMNVGKAGRDIVGFVDKLDEYLAALKPKAVAYLVGREDYEKGESGIDAFKTALKSLIQKALAERDNGGFAVIQLPHAVKDAERMEQIELYAAAVETVVNGMDSALLRRIVVVDHLSQTKNDSSFLNSKLNADGLLNADGHYEIAKQLAAATVGLGSDFQSFISWEMEDGPASYLADMPTVTAKKDSLLVTMPDGAQGDDWNYILTINETEIVGSASGASFEIENLRPGASYALAVQSQDGTVQYASVYGTVEEGCAGSDAPALSALQKAIRDRVNDKSKPLTWLFMGDSITHGAWWTFGYDGIVQIVDKYLKEDLGRTDDIVINTANFNATTQTTLDNIEQRLTKYKPDIVSVMIGTNDANGKVALAQYRENLKTLVEKIRSVNKDAQIIFRTPTPANATLAGKITNNGYLAAMKDVAEEDGRILLIDQYTEWAKEINIFPYQLTSAYEYGDNSLHPGAAGQLRMAKQFIRECGLNMGTRITDMDFKFSFETAESKETPDVVASESAIMVSKSELQKKYASETIGDLEVTATDTVTNRTYKKSSGVDGDRVYITNLPTGRGYLVDVKAKIAGSKAKYVTFATASVDLQKGQAAPFDVQLTLRDGTDLKRIVENAVVGELSVDELAPEGEYAYALCDGEGSTDNGLFKVDGNKIKIAEQLEFGEVYSIRIKAVSGTYISREKIVTFETPPQLDAVRRAARESYQSDKMALDLDLSGETFDGTNYIDLADSSGAFYDGGGYLQVLNNLVKKSVGGSIILRIKTSANQGTILAAGSNTTVNDNRTTMLGLQSGAFRGHFRTASGNAVGNFSGCPTLTDGKWHTLAFSFDTTKADCQNQALLSVDGGENIYPSSWWTLDLQTWFNKASDEITQFSIGGGALASSTGGMGAFNGEIESVTITNKIYTESQLRGISGEQMVLERQKLEVELEELETVYEKESNLAPESFEAFQSAYDSARKAFESGEQDPKVLTDLLDALRQKHLSLQAAELAQMHSSAGEALNRYKDVWEKDKDKYTVESWNKFADACRQVQDAVTDDSLNLDALNELLRRMDEAYEGLIANPQAPQSDPVRPETGAKAKKLMPPAVSSVKMVGTKKVLGVEIRISGVAGADSYTVYRMQGGRIIEIGKAGADGVVYDLNPAAGKTVSYYAVAESSNAMYTRSDKGAAKSLKLAASTKKLKAKRVPGKTQVRLTWKKVKGAKQYLIYRSEKKDSGYAQVKTIKKASTVSFVDKKVKKNKKYYYRLVVKGKQGLTGPRTSKMVKVKK